ncbi:hypothetical protein D3C85_1252790 [compost metagenome]
MVSLVGFRLGCILIALKRSDLELIILRGFGDVRVAQQLGLLPLLFGIRLLDPRIPQCFRFGNFCIPLHSSDPRFPERFEVTVLVAHVFNSERNNLQPHLLQVTRCDSLHLLGKTVTVAVDLFYGH